MSAVTILSKIFIFNTLATILIIAGHYIFASNEILINEQALENVLDSFSSNEDRYLVFVSTMDGYISALNGKTGQLQWTLSTGSGSLLSSSISEKPMIRHGRETRLVPSLDGSLYQMDEDGVEPIPIGADTLLSSTVKLFDSSTVVGGRTIESYAIDLNSGKVKYVCSLDGCELVDSYLNESTLKRTSGDVLLIRRNDRVIRMVEMLSGSERWNYSVGQHDLTFISSVDVVRSIEQFINSKVKKNPVNFSERMFRNTVTGDLFDSSQYDKVEIEDLSIGVNIASGLIKSVSKNDPTHEYWNYKFDSAVAGVWQLQGRRLIDIDLFDDENIIEHETIDRENYGSRFLYIGSYNDQPYIQPSQLLKKELDAALNDMGKSKNGITMPRIRWRPYLYNALSRTRTIKNCDDCETNALIPSMNEQYPFDGGSYLRREYTPIKEISYIHSGFLFNLVNLLNRNLPYWKEILAMALMVLATPLIWSSLQYMSTQRMARLAQIQVVDNNSCLGNVTAIEPTLPQPSHFTNAFNSRYQTDFIHIECLGKGGFGVVFKAKNVVDDCEYAVKRIALYDSESARGRVMREVKALAKLEHPGIVRYYQSWFENPPLGWQESQDSLYTDIPMSQTETTSNPLSTDRKYMKKNICSDMSKNNMANNLFNCNEMNNDLFCDDYEENASKNAFFEISSSFNEKYKDNNDFSIVFTDVEVNNSLINNDLSSKDSKFSRCLDNSESIVFIDESLQKSTNHSYRRQVSLSRTEPNINKMSHSNALPIKSYKSMNKINKKMDTNSNEHINRGDNNYHNKNAKSYLYIQMQLCKSESLKDWLQNRNKNNGEIDRGNIERYQLLNIFHQIVSAIDYVHSQNLMHRDLKPSNIFFAMDGLVKIGDFGLVTAVEDSYDDEGYKSRSSDNQHTKRVGTTLYMSPEQAAGKKYTNKVDIYALGVIFFEMFNFFSTEMERIKSLQNLSECKYPPEFMENYKEEFEFLKPLLAKTPHNRPDADKILKEELLQPFEESVNAFYRVHSRTRNTSKSFSDGSPIIELTTP